MRIIGIDPGTGILGFGVIDVDIVERDFHVAQTIENQHQATESQ